jgi:type I restriction enzyme, S subunit
MNPYPSYKESGVEWVGEIPSGWNLTKLKYESNLIVDGTHFTPTYTEEGVPFLRVTDIHSDTINLEKVKHISIEEHSELIKRCNPRKGDLLLSKNGTIGLTKVVDWEWEFSIFVSLCLIRFKDSFSQYLFSYTFQSDVVDQQLVESSKQSTVTNLHLDKIRELVLIKPSIKEQKRIVEHLDKETSKIDSLIEKTQQKIELLKEQRTSLINQVVTKGLNPDVEMKDSGVEWIGEIPIGWESVSLRPLVTKVGSGSTPRGGSENYPDQGITFLRSQNIHFDGLRLDNVVFISPETHNQMSGSSVQRNDLLLNITGGSIGRCCVVDSDLEMNVNQHVSIIRTTLKLTPDFLNYVLSSDIGQEQVIYNQTGGNREGLTSDNIKNFNIGLPSIEEQQQIVDHIEKKTTKIDSTIEKETQRIELLKEYRQSLISEVVTGKIRITEDLL